MEQAAPPSPDLSTLVLRRRAKDAPSAQQLSQALASGTIIKQTDAGLVAACPSPGQTDRALVIKTHTLATAAHRLRSRLGLARLDNQWKGAARLAKHALPTPRCLLLGRLPKRGGMPPADLLVMHAAQGPTLLHALAHPDAIRPELIAAAATLAGRLANAGLFNRDLKPSNIIVEQADPPALTIIDTVAIRTSRRTRAESLERMCFSLFVEQFGVGMEPDRVDFKAAADAALPHILQREPTEHEAAEFIARVRRRLDLHPDPTPTDNPLN